MLVRIHSHGFQSILADIQAHSLSELGCHVSRFISSNPAVLHGVFFELQRPFDALEFFPAARETGWTAIENAYDKPQVPGETGLRLG